MQPSLALNYNSGAGYGYIGHGWSLSGKSVISRCSRSLAIDGYNRSAVFDDKDAFCLDGARLIEVTGASRTLTDSSAKEFRTERESGDRIAAYFAATTEPAYFKVWHKNGNISDFGDTADSNIKTKTYNSALPVATSTWAISRTKSNFPGM